MNEVTLFMLVLMTQIFLLSVYFPSRILHRSQYVLENYPATTHPKLYPKSSQYFKRAMTLYKWVNILNVMLGLALLYFIYNGDLVGEKGINPMLPWGYFMLQMIPSQLLEFFGMRLTKLMKQQDQRRQKSAQLKPRKLTDYVSAKLLAAVILSYFGFILVGLYLEDFVISSGSKTLVMSGILLIGMLFFIGLSRWLIRGKVKDPYQSERSRHKVVSMVIKTFCYTVIACSGFMLMTLLVVTFDLKTIMPIIMSLFLQLLVILSMGFMLHNNRLEDIDFDVYKSA